MPSGCARDPRRPLKNGGFRRLIVTPGLVPCVWKMFRYCRLTDIVKDIVFLRRLKNSFEMSDEFWNWFAAKCGSYFLRPRLRSCSSIRSTYASVSRSARLGALRAYPGIGLSGAGAALALRLEDGRTI